MIRSVSTPRRILFIAEGQLGDLLLLTPAIRAMKESFPSSFISVLVVERRTRDSAKPVEELAANSEERERSVFATNRYVDEILVVSRDALRSRRGIARVRAEIAVALALRRKRFDTVVCTFPEERFALWAFASGAATRVGQNRQALRWMLSHTPEIEKARGGVLQYYCDLVRAVGATVRSAHTEYTVPDASAEWAEGVFREYSLRSVQRVVAIHPGATGDYKIWPPERYAALIERLTERGMRVLLLNGLLDEPVVSAIRSLRPRSFIEITTAHRLADLAAIIRRSHLCITNDSGPRHLAVAVGTPSLALFRHHHDREWGIYPQSNRCRTLQGETQCPACPSGVCLDKVPESERYGAFCLRQITVDDVLRQVDRMLSAVE